MLKSWEFRGLTADDADEIQKCLAGVRRRFVRPIARAAASCSTMKLRECVGERNVHAIEYNALLAAMRRTAAEMWG